MQDVIGPKPIRAADVGTVLANRILVISSEDIEPLPSFDDYNRSDGRYDKVRGSNSVEEDTEDDVFLFDQDIGGIREPTGQLLGLDLMNKGVTPGDPDDWGFAAADELAALYYSGPVITLPPLSRLVSSDYKGGGVVDNPAYMQYLIAKRKNRSSISFEGGDVDDDSEDSLYLSSWHKEVAIIVSDWLHMLIVFGYI